MQSSAEGYKKEKSYKLKSFPKVGFTPQVVKYANEKLICSSRSRIQWA